MKLKLVIVADHNDADYNTDIVDVTPEQLERLMPVIKAVKAFKPYQGAWPSDSTMKTRHNSNWPRGEYGHRPDMGEKSPEELYGEQCSTDAIEEFDELVPMEDGNVHTIDSVTLLKVAEEEELL